MCIRDRPCHLQGLAQTTPRTARAQGAGLGPPPHQPGLHGRVAQGCRQAVVQVDGVRPGARLCLA
eukprot:9230795-Lingulodinium_polyedra.AAC.1